MLRCHMEQPRPWLLPPAILPPPVAPPLPPALAAPELFQVRALSQGCSQASSGEGRWGRAAGLDRTTGLEVQAWGDNSGAAALATAGDTGVPQSQGHQGRRSVCPRVPNHRCHLPHTPSAVCGTGWPGSSRRCLRPPPPANATFLLSQEPPQPALGTGSPAAPSRSHVPPHLLLTPFAALEDPPPPTREPLLQHKAARR